MTLSKQWQTLRQFGWRWRGVWLTVPVTVLLVLGGRGLGLLEGLELAALDQFFLRRPVEGPDDRIVLVTVDEADIQALGTWPLPDDRMAQLLQNLRGRSPYIIGLDFYRDVPVPPGTLALQQVLTASTQQDPKIIGVEKLVSSADSAAVAPQPILQGANQVGINDFLQDPDGRTRRFPIYASLPGADSRFSLSFILACQYLENRLGGTCGQSPDLQVQLEAHGRTTRLPQIQPNSGGYSREEAGGYQMLLNYRGPARFSGAAVHCRRNRTPPSALPPQPFAAVCLTDVLANDWPAELDLRDRIVLVGPVAQSLNDLFYTPYSGTLFSPPQRMPGVVIHANAISQLLSAALQRRPLIHTLPDGAEQLWIGLWGLLGAVLSWYRGYLGSSLDGRPKAQSNRQRWGRLVLELSLLSGSLILFCYGAFLLGWWVPLVPPLLALGGTAIAINAYVARTATEIRKIFGRYVTDQVVTTLLESPEGLKIGGDRRRITILTSDVRGFTATAERLSPEKVVQVLNLYLSAMTDVIEAYNGTIDAFIGDGILVLFGAPTAAADDAARAVACAVAMQQAMPQVNAKVQALNDGIPLEMGIGINTGEVVVGNIGSEKHTKYSVIGKHVNLAYRIEAFTVGGQILISDSTRDAVAEQVKLGDRIEVQAKGLQTPIPVYDVLGIGAPFNLTLPQLLEEWVTLVSPMPVEYVVLEGKQIHAAAQLGQLVRLSENSAELRLPTDAEPLGRLSNLKLNLHRAESVKTTQATLEHPTPDLYTEDLYAKVVGESSEAISSDHAPCLIIRFTARSPLAQQWMEHQRLQAIELQAMALQAMEL